MQMPQVPGAAFVAAAHEAGLCVLPDDVAETRKAAEKKSPTERQGPEMMSSALERATRRTTRLTFEAFKARNSHLHFVMSINDQISAS